MKADELKGHIDELSELLLKPWWNLKHVTRLKTIAVKLLDGMKKYYDYLSTTCTRMKEHHKSEGMCHCVY